MEDRKPAGRRDAGRDKREMLAGRESAANARERVADERDVLASEREVLAGERDRTADEREALADQREGLADEREHRADEREARAERAGSPGRQRERELDERARRLGTAIETLGQRTLETIERSRALLQASEERLDRQEAAVRRSQARIGREQADVDRAAAESERGLAAQLPDPGMAAQQSQALRKQAVAAIEALAENEEETARALEQLAGSRPANRREYRHSAAQARASARRARQILQALASDLPPAPDATGSNPPTQMATSARADRDRRPIGTCQEVPPGPGR